MERTRRLLQHAAPEDCTISFKRAGFIADSSKFWILSDYLLKVCPKLKPELADFRQQFEQAFCKKILDDFSISQSLINSKEAEERAEQYAIYAMLKKNRFTMNMYFKMQ